LRDLDGFHATQINTDETDDCQWFPW
jgi:hypothetical protein